MADQQQLSAAVTALCKRLAELGWDATHTEEHCQLHQVHLWLAGQQPGAGGLAGTLSAAQLRQCAEAWEQQLQGASLQRRTSFERQVFSCAQQLPCLVSCSQKARTADGAFSVDVAATHAGSGRRLAIEADGPAHFLLHGREMTGNTLARNRVLASRGYVVVSVPYWEWDEMKGDAAQKAAYLQRKVEAALQQQAPGCDGGSRPGGGAAAAS